MQKNVFTTEWLVELLRKCSTKCPYVSVLKIDNEQAVPFITDLLHSALQQIFLSQEHFKEYEYDAIFSRYVDAMELFHTYGKDLGFELEVTEIPFYDEVSGTQKFRRVESLPSKYDMCAVAYDDLYTSFVEGIETFLSLGGELNPYATVRILSINPNNSFVVELGEDIRNKVYRELFPNGRYHKLQ